MIGLAREVTDVVLEMLRDHGELAQWLTERTFPAGQVLEPADRIVGWQISNEVNEKNLQLRYPNLAVYCAGIKNEQREKFRRFSGRLEMVVETRVSAERVNDLQGELQDAVEAVAARLEAWKGDWGEGRFFGGGYEVQFGAVKPGGKGFVQTAKVVFAVEVSRG
jgi:hypothetical protein